ncbi:uncharacterized protein SPPG_09134 [Spizellomyces punctatus DAOM BR117]|uniref:NADH dehydrogenase [ubiquinone] 1 alpha subcomplex subunit 1 n=1 Tax=Spizellomyces punctatus (strain DAOM BR117) TaxID=645134 RepID=A0A0L0HLW8_SPIPD|nr:uncharacterized protein SPPG_09134 [Spizellomyces punctatus DAOM BR117]KND01910.1 hypothetical protein SPPG_09134 [Spizellomyces punctatus DAOM BR117]|eukprot:XP_016609949.1 hypothetical protein SPPG_09134 [Spizellomyces punctatus DAOM BR117]
MSAPASRQRWLVPIQPLFPLMIIGVLGVTMRWGVKKYQEYENWGKPKRWSVDRWDRRMMERDSRLTGNVNFQRAEVEAPKEFLTNSAWEVERPFM